jgi:hypothetical protein
MTELKLSTTEKGYTFLIGDNPITPYRGTKEPFYYSTLKMAIKETLKEIRLKALEIAAQENTTT